MVPVATPPATTELAQAFAGKPLRIGVVNIMPRAETYEACLVRPLERALLPVAPVWIRLASHHYQSSDIAHIQRAYVTFDGALRGGPLDGLILTGAPVEDLEFHDVRYWTEICDILDFCRTEVAGVLGICWGGLALAKQVGIEKELFHKKLFGVFQNVTLDPEHSILGGSDDTFWCAHSRHSGIRSADLEAARDAGLIKLLSYGPETGYSIFETSDRRFLAHLGHPEYEAARIAHEWERDSALGRRDVDPPRNFDPSHPANVWRSHCNHLFARWLRYVALERSRRHPIAASGGNR
jgi:homoserine O-succinyltransferase